MNPELSDRAKVARRIAIAALVAAVGSCIAGPLGTVVALVMSFGALGTVRAEDKATTLSEGISAAMNWTAFGLLGSLVFGGVSVVLFIRARRIAKASTRASA